MNQIRVFSLYSGSSGNSFLISAPGGAILIDAGKSAKRLCQSLNEVGVSPDDLLAVLITHEHSDHISALPVFLKKHPIPVHLPQGCFYRLEKEPAVAPHLHPHPSGSTEEIGGMRITSFATPHDSNASVGYRIEIPLGESKIFRLGYATDIGYVTDTVENSLCGCDAVILESNHDPEMLRTGPYPYQLKTRIASRKGHLSNGDSALLASRLCAGGTKSLMLAHLSAENNTPELAFDECFCAVGDAGVTICIAHPEEITELPLEVPV